jgi:hypothetical protein
MLNEYLEKCWDITLSFDEFDIRHICRAKNYRANNLAQKALGYPITQGRFHIAGNLITKDAPGSQLADSPVLSCGPSSVELSDPVIRTVQHQQECRLI